MQLGKVAGYGLNGQDSISVTAKDFSLRHHFQPDQGIQSASYPKIYLHGLPPPHIFNALPLWNVSDPKRHASISGWRYNRATL
jgi:hypothetical protein